MKSILFVSLMFVVACAKNHAQPQTENDLKKTTMYVTNWGSVEPWLTLDLSAGDSTIWTEAFGTRCKSQVTQTATELVMSNSQVVGEFQQGDLCELQTDGSCVLSCKAFDGTYGFQYSSGTLSLCQTAPYNLPCEEFH